MSSAIIYESLLLSDIGLYDLEKKSMGVSAKKKKKAICFQTVSYKSFLN